MAVEEGYGIWRAYRSQARPSHREALQALFDAVAAEVPGAEVALRRRVPAFRHQGRTLVSIGDAAGHVSLYVMQGAALDVHAAELADHDVSATVVRFPPHLPIPTELVRRLVRTRVDEVDAAASGARRR